jgi:hypothetical protein
VPRLLASRTDFLMCVAAAVAVRGTAHVIAARDPGARAGVTRTGIGHAHRLWVTRTGIGVAAGAGPAEKTGDQAVVCTEKREHGLVHDRDQAIVCTDRSRAPLFQGSNPVPSTSSQRRTGRDCRDTRRRAPCLRQDVADVLLSSVHPAAVRRLCILVRIYTLTPPLQSCLFPAAIFGTVGDLLRLGAASLASFCPMVRGSGEVLTMRKNMPRTCTTANILRSSFFLRAPILRLLAPCQHCAQVRTNSRAHTIRQTRL